MPVLYLGRGAPPLFEDALWIKVERRKLIGGQEDMIIDIALDLTRARDTVPA